MKTQPQQPKTVTENDLLEQALAIAQTRGYAPAYEFLRRARRGLACKNAAPVYYYLLCFAAGQGHRAQALAWLRAAVQVHGYWYRPEIFEDDDLVCLYREPAFRALTELSAVRFAAAAKRAAPVCTWQGKTAENLLLVLHGNTQSAAIARSDWSPLGWPGLQIEAVQSSTVDCTGRWRWNYDDANYLDFARAAAALCSQPYAHRAWGGFSAGCDMLLRTLVGTELRCDLLLLQSPWTPLLETAQDQICSALLQKNTELRLFCGTEDEDCRGMAERLYAAAQAKGCRVSLHWQQGGLHSFPGQMLGYGPGFAPAAEPGEPPHREPAAPRAAAGLPPQTAT